MAVLREGSIPLVGKADASGLLGLPGLRRLLRWQFPAALLLPQSCPGSPGAKTAQSQSCHRRLI